MDNLIFSHFPPISEKQWKQKIQYLLKGEDYQSLIQTNTDGISTLPFYTKSQLDKSVTPTPKNITTPCYYCVVTDEKKANIELIEAIKNGITCVYLALFNPKANLSIVLQNIDCHIIIQCYFLDANLNIPPLQNKRVIVLNDCLGKISKTGNWYSNAKEDFKNLNAILKNTTNSISINLSTFQNAGATQLQQLSYAMAQLLAYAENTKLNKNATIYYHVSVDTDLYIEVAKLKALRVLHSLITESLDLPLHCKIIQHKSKRNLSGLHSEINEALTATERHISILGGVDFFLSTPNHFFFYKEDLLSVSEHCEDLINSSKQTDPSIVTGVIYIEKLTQQLAEKSLILIKTIQNGGGYLEQLKKETIQQKIAAHEKTSTLNFIEQNRENAIPIIQKKTSIGYPFLKFKKRKTLWKSIIEKQLRETLERPIWEKNYQL